MVAALLHVIRSAALGTLVLSAGLAMAADPAPANSTVPTKTASKPAAAGPTWNELNRGQQAALKPLSASWNTLSEAQKRKWLALSTNFSTLHPDEQARLHERMTAWAALSPQQRAQARLNFAETRKLTGEEKKAKWDAYQALSSEERAKLAARNTQPTGASVPVKPVAPQKLASVPRPENRKHPAKVGPNDALATEAPRVPPMIAPAPAEPHSGTATLVPTSPSAQ